MLANEAAIRQAAPQHHPDPNMWAAPRELLLGQEAQAAATRGAAVAVVAVVAAVAAGVLGGAAAAAAGAAVAAEERCNNFIYNCESLNTYVGINVSYIIAINHAFSTVVYGQ